MASPNERLLKLFERDVMIAPRRHWCKFWREIPSFDGRIVKVNADREMLQELLAAVRMINAGDHELVIWVPPEARGERLSKTLRWGYTVFAQDGELVAFQRVVFIKTRARLIVPGLRTVGAVAQEWVSLWDGLPIDHPEAAGN